MKLSDERVIEFLYASPLKSFAGMLDALRYVDNVPVPYESESELVDDALGDDVEEEPKVRVPEIRGIPPIALLAFIEQLILSKSSKDVRECRWTERRRKSVCFTN